MIRPVLLAACLLAAPAFAQAQAAVSAPAPAPALPPAQAPAFSPRAMAIARMIVPLDVSTEATMREAKKAFFITARTDPGMVDLEKSYPGIAAALWPVVEQEIRKASVEEHGPYLEGLAAFMTSRLAPAELDAMHAFYASATGQRVIAEMFRGINVDGMMAEIISTGGQSVSAAAIESTLSTEARRVAGTLRPEDMPALQTLLRGISEAKLMAFNADLRRFMVEWINKPTPELDARIAKVVDEWMLQYMIEHPARD